MAHTYLVRTGGARRAVKVEPNMSGGEGVTVAIYNLDGNHPVWQNNVQMAPKQMKVIEQTNDKIVLRGYGSDAMGASFADYGLTIKLKNDVLENCILHMHDRNIDIEYIKEEVIFATTQAEIVSLAKRANAQFEQEMVTDGRQLLVQIYRSVKYDPEQLRNVRDYSSLGTSFLWMLIENISDDIDTLQMMSSLGYLFLSKAIINEPRNLNLFRNRLLILRAANEPLGYTVKRALNIDSDMFSISGSMSSYRARDAIYKMEIADLELFPDLCRNFDIFKERKDEFDSKINRGFFGRETTTAEIINSGIENHVKLLEYLENMVLNEADVDF
jgi:hypothetical protein